LLLVSIDIHYLTKKSKFTKSFNASRIILIIELIDIKDSLVRMFQAYIIDKFELSINDLMR